MKTTPENITHLAAHQIFVFGSNVQGVHGKGAAKIAEQLFGAVRGVGEGLSGQSYAIPTREILPPTKRHRGCRFHTLDPIEIKWAVNKFIMFAIAHPELEFFVTPIGCGFAGHKPEDIKPLFQHRVENVILPECFQ